MTRIFILISIILTCMLSEAQARHRHKHHYRHHHRDHHYIASGSGTCSEKLNDGQVIRVACSVASKFVGFFNDLYAREGKLAPINCLASGHMANSLHHWGGACDVGQTARNVAWRAMYHVGDLAAKYGLTDGCIWRNPDCGHVDVSGVGGTHYASRGRRHYASYARVGRRHYARKTPQYTHFAFGW